MQDTKEIMKLWDQGKVKLTGYRLEKPSLEITFLFEKV
jgi:hypothetical protein